MYLGIIFQVIFINFSLNDIDSQKITSILFLLWSIQAQSVTWGNSPGLDATRLALVLRERVDLLVSDPRLPDVARTSSQFNFRRLAN